MIRTTLGLALGVLTLLLAVGSVRAQQPTGGIGFRNETTVTIVIEGASFVDGMLRRGQRVPIAPGKLGWDTNVAKGPRYVIIYDATQPSRILYREPPIPFQGPDLILSVRPHPSQRDRVVLILKPGGS